MSVHRIAVIAGDGIGQKSCQKVCVPWRQPPTASHRAGFPSFRFASCTYFCKHGQMLPDDWKARSRARYHYHFVAVGWPDTVPSHVSL